MQNSIGAPKQRLSLSDPRVRAWLFQILAVIAVVALGWFLFDNTQTNLQHRGITSGFDFLERSAGFGIAQHLIDYTESDSYARVFVIGLLNTLLVTVICSPTVALTACWPASSTGSVFSITMRGSSSALARVRVCSLVSSVLKGSSRVIEHRSVTL
mgnify:CR=1 FL=1